MSHRVGLDVFVHFALEPWGLEYISSGAGLERRYLLYSLDSTLEKPSSLEDPPFPPSTETKPIERISVPSNCAQ